MAVRINGNGRTETRSGKTVFVICPKGCSACPRFVMGESRVTLKDDYSGRLKSSKNLIKRIISV